MTAGATTPAAPSQSPQDEAASAELARHPAVQARGHAGRPASWASLLLLGDSPGLDRSTALPRLQRLSKRGKGPTAGRLVFICLDCCLKLACSPQQVDRVPGPASPCCPGHRRHCQVGPQPWLCGAAVDIDARFPQPQFPHRLVNKTPLALTSQVLAGCGAAGTLPGVDSHGAGVFQTPGRSRYVFSSVNWADDGHCLGAHRVQ